MNQVDLKRIDWRLFKRQKQKLIDLALKLETDGNGKAVKALDGVITLMDYLQDAQELEAATFECLYPPISRRVHQLKFICPDCDHDRIEEVVSTDTLINPIVRLDKDGDHEYEPCRPEGATEVLEYRCAYCAWIISNASGDIRDCVELAEWLKKQPYNKHKKQRKKK